MINRRSCAYALAVAQNPARARTLRKKLAQVRPQGEKPEVAEHLERLEKLVHEMNERLKAIESKAGDK